MSGSDLNQFDFNTWVAMARNNPSQFEAMRKQLIEQTIQQSNPEYRQRMEGLQWQIDQIRSTSSNPLSSCIKLSRMMWDTVLGENGLLENMETLTRSDPIQRRSNQQQSAEIIQMKPYKPEE